MTKQNGLGDEFLLDGVWLSGDIGSIKRVAGPMAPLSVTGINKSAMERIGGPRDGGIDFTAWFNPAAGGSMAATKPMPTTDRVATYLRGVGIGKPSACLVCKQTSFDLKRPGDGSLTIDVSTLANSYGVEWGEQLTNGIRTDTTATDGTSFDGGYATVCGLQAYLQVFSFTGTDAVIKVQDSADDISFADVTGGAFTTVTAGPTTGRIQTARDGALARYTRIATTGTFTSLSFQVTLVRNQTLVVF